MKVLNGSGGSTKGIQLAIATIELFDRGFKPDVVSATSVYSIIALPLLLGMYDEVISECMGIEPEEMFTVLPVNKKGITFKAKMRAIKGMLGFKDNYSLGVQDTRHFTKKYITEAIFNEYKESDLADIIIMTVNYDNGYPVLYRAKSLSYDEYVEAVEKSAHIPVMTDAVGSEVDGGNWAHNPEWYLLLVGAIQPTEMISVYVREQEFRINSSTEWRKNLIKYIERGMQVFNVALSTAGQFGAYWYCKANGIKHLQLFCPQVLDEMYDFDDEQLREASNITLISIKHQLEIWQTLT
jgi:predicted acylesterase/phospholipase RssA